MDTERESEIFPEISAMWRHSGGMKSSPKTGTEIEINRQVKSLKAAADRLLADPARAKEFFVRHGFITPTGKLPARYRSK